MAWTHPWRMALFVGKRKTNRQHVRSVSVPVLNGGTAFTPNPHPNRSSSPKAHHTGKGDLVDDEMCLTSTPLSADHSQHSSCRDTSARRVSGSTKSRTAVTISGTGSSSRRSGGRSNFFFGSDYAASKKLPSDSVECGGKATAGREAASPNRGGVLASKDQKARRGGKLEGEAGRTKALAVQDGQVIDCCIPLLTLILINLS